VDPPLNSFQTIRVTHGNRNHLGTDAPTASLTSNYSNVGFPTLKDLAVLFEAEPLSESMSKAIMPLANRKQEHRRYRELFLVATSLEVFLKDVRLQPSRTLYVCHASRDDILLGFMGEYQRRLEKFNRCSSINKSTDNVEVWESALVICGVDNHPITSQSNEILLSPSTTLSPYPEVPPILLTKLSMVKILQLFNSFTPELSVNEKKTLQSTLTYSRPFVDFDMLLDLTAECHQSNLPIGA